MQPPAWVRPKRVTAWSSVSPSASDMTAQPVCLRVSFSSAESRRLLAFKLGLQMFDAAFEAAGFDTASQNLQHVSQP